MAQTQKVRKGNIAMLLDNPFQKDARVMKEINTLHKEGFQITVFALTEEGLQSCETFNTHSLQRIFSPMLFKPMRSQYQIHSTNWVTLILSIKPDVVHCHDLYTLPIGNLVKKQAAQVKLVYDSHEYWRGISFKGRLSGVWNKFKNFLVWQYFLWQESKLLKTCDGFIGASEAITRKLSKIAGGTPLPLALPNYPDAKLHTAGPVYRDDRFALCSLGNVYVELDVYVNLCTALVELQIPSTLYIINDTRQGEEYFQQLSTRFTGTCIDFQILPYGNEASILQTLQQMDVGLQLLDRESKSQQITSFNRFNLYVNAGLPILCDPTLEASEINKSTETITWLKGHDKKSFSEALGHLWKNRENLRENARMWTNRYSWEINAPKLVSFYKNLVNP